jgi:hypothetical protein
MPDLADLVDHWHEFYILLGTAAAGQVSDLSPRHGEGATGAERGAKPVLGAGVC